MNYKPEIAIIEPNTLCSLGLKSILEERDGIFKLIGCLLGENDAHKLHAVLLGAGD